MKLRVLFLLTIFAAAPAFGQQQFAKTGVVNIPVINQSYKLAVAKHFDELKALIQKDLDRMREEIRVLSDQRAEAQKRGDAAKVASMDAEIQAKKDAFAEFGRKKQEELTAAGETYKNDAVLQKFLPQDIEQAAISKGFALILNSTNSSVFWYGPDADITAEVIRRLAAETQLPMEVPKDNQKN